MNSTSDDKEVGRVVVGIPGVTAQIPVRSSFLARIGSVLRRQAIDQAGRIVSVRAHVHVPEDDNGQVDVYLKLVNVSRRPLTVENLFLQQFSAGGSELPGVAPVLTPLRNGISPAGHAEVHFRSSLGAPAIRQLVRAVQKAQNLRSSPRVQLVFVGSLEVRIGKRRDRLPFSIGTNTPELSLSCPSAGRD